MAPELPDFYKVICNLSGFIYRPTHAKTADGKGTHGFKYETYAPPLPPSPNFLPA